MEKLIYSLWEAQEGKLRDELADAMAAAGAQNLRINIADEHVTDGAGLIQSRGEPLPNAVLQFWMPSSNPIFRKSLDDVIARYCSSYHGWLVAESTIIENEDHPPQTSARTEGFAQMAFLTLPSGKTWQQWRDVWRDYHTQVAIDTQSNFEYRQNMVIEPLTAEAPPFVAIIEECFPKAALSDPFVFFDAVGDQAKFDKNLGRMMESCGRFIEMGTIDVIPTSQYQIG